MTSPTPHRVGTAWQIYGRDVWTALVTGAVALSLFAFQHESDARKDQNCVLFERADREEIRQLQQTYDFIVKPPPGLESLATAILPTLNHLETQAKDRAPDYCDSSDVGLGGKTPKLPKRPPEVEKALKALTQKSLTKALKR